MSRAHVVTLGCDKNRADSEGIAGRLVGMGLSLADSPESAELIVVNTCGFIREAVRESIDIVLEMAEHKKTGRCKALVVAGCMSERYRDGVLKDLPEADHVVGVGELEKIAEIAAGFSPGGAHGVAGEPRLLAREALGRPHVAYLKIAEGCSSNCAYCTIPSIRGPYRSRPMEEIAAECRGLAELGAREIVLVAQDTALYGQDIYGAKQLPGLLRLLADAGAPRLRLMYAYPEHVTAKLMEAMAELDCVCKYIDMPMQHCEKRVLSAMGRGGGKYELEGLVRVMRANIPGLFVRTTLMVGFPGETESDFESLCEFAKTMRFERMGVFPYSQEDGTPAAKMPQHSERLKKARYRKLMRLQQEIHMEVQRGMVGSRVEVMVDEFLPDGGGYAGRAYFDAPEVDACIRFSSDSPLRPGELCEVDVTEADGYDLRGVRI